MSTARTSPSKPPPLPTSPPAPSAATPRTPLSLNRSISGLNSPSLSNLNAFRTDDEVYVYHLSATCLRAGFGGEQVVRSIIRFTPELQQRPGNYDKFLQSQHEYLKSRRKVPQPESSGGVGQWGCDRELYRPNLMGLDIGLTEDTFQRAVRQANTEDLLVLDESARKRQVNLVVSSALPQPLLEGFVEQIFQTYPQPTSITLFSESIMCTVAAGLRSALVVDLGWHEAVVSAIYEYREVSTKRSQRSGKRLSWQVARLLQSKLNEEDEQRGLAVEDVEEVVQRMCWCRKQSQAEQQQDTMIDITLPSLSPSKVLSVGFNDLSDPAERVFFTNVPVEDDLVPLASNVNERLPPTPPPDDHLTPLPMLIYQSLLSLPPDIRGHLFSRIIFTGGCSNIPGLKSRTLIDLADLIRKRGWSPVNSYGRNPAKYSGITVEIEGLSTSTTPPNTEPRQGPGGQPKLPSPTPPDSPTSTGSGDTTVQHQSSSPLINTAANEKTLLPPPSDRPPEADPILAKLQRTSPKTITQHTPREKIALRAVKTLGSWAGASLLSGLRVKGTVEIERDAFLRHGLGGAGRRGTKRDNHEQVDRDRAGVRTGSPEKKGRQSILPPGKLGDTADSRQFGLGPWS